MAPPINLLAKTVEQRFTFHFRPGDPLETNCAVADVRSGQRRDLVEPQDADLGQGADRARTWGCRSNKVKVHVAAGRWVVRAPPVRRRRLRGRRHLAEARQAREADVASHRQLPPGPRPPDGAPRASGRPHLGGNVLAFDQRNTSVATDWSHGFGELLSATGRDPARARTSATRRLIFSLTANVPYDFGVVTQLLNEIYEYNTFNTSAVRNVYSPEVTTPRELLVDQLAKAMGQDPYQFRRSFVRDARMRAVLDKVAQVGNWGRAMAPGTAQGLGIHREYKGYCACLVEIDCRPATVNRQIPNAYTGPRVTKAVCAIDVGLPINPLGLEAQMMGGIMDGIGQVLSYSLHLKDGYFLEGSWDDAFYTRQWNTPPADRRSSSCRRRPTSRAAPASSPSRRRWPPRPARTPAPPARVPTSFPVNHNRSDLGFTPIPTVPPVPAVAHRRPAAHLLRSARAPAHVHPQRQASQRRLRRRRPAAVGAQRPARRPRAQVRLRRRRLPGLHQPHQRQGVQPLRGARVPDQGHATRSPRSRGWPRPSASRCIPCSRPGSTTTWRSAATASPARS